MSWVVSNNPDVEFDSLQPCFYPDEDDFYLCSPDSDPPGEDIWKKFELVPTHSLSLSSARLQSGPLSPCQGSLLEYGLPRDGDALDWASELLLLPPEPDLLGGSGWALLQGTELGWSPSNLKSNIIQDCMWSGISAMGRLESALIEKLSNAAGTMKCATPSQPGTTTVSMVPGRIEVMSNPTSHSVDPAVVFPFPVNKGESCRGTQGGSVTARGATSPPCTSPTAPSSAAPARNSTQCCRTSTSSEYESHSDSEEEETAVKKEEEEEVDGTVEKRCTSSNNPGTSLTITLLPKNSNAASGKTAQNKSILKQCAPALQQHNYAALSPYVNPDKAASAQKKHTVLERQRRNNLTTRLLTLKHNVPELVNNDKAAKAFILKKATEYIHSLQADNQKLLQAKEKLQARQQRLLKKLKHTWTS
ncbi:N-myc protein-like [Ascaphus truei]|uniref:N-myc protein-like n=1 Tax=Ascaphus truei TaxID=8439 RepID=UPI003F5A8557